MESINEIRKGLGVSNRVEKFESVNEGLGL